MGFPLRVVNMATVKLHMLCAKAINVTTTLCFEKGHADTSQKSLEFLYNRFMDSSEDPWILFQLTVNHIAYLSKK